MAEETIVAIYDTSTHADAAIRDLQAVNVPADAISRQSAGTGVAGTAATGRASAGAAAVAEPRETGFWSSLFGGEPDHDTTVYDRSVAGGSHVVTVKAPAEHVADVVDILERHSPIDIDERAAGYGLTAGATTTTTRETLATPVAAAPVAAAGLRGGDQTLQLAEEQLSVGKRLVSRGTTRIRRFVVETPVQENVTLHSERVSVERRPVTGNVQATDDSFKDHVIEVRETEEEAVVTKTARVKEEIVVRKDVADRVETVRDTVRREEIEVVNDGVTKTGAATTGTAKTAATKPGTVGTGAVGTGAAGTTGSAGTVPPRR